MTAEWHMTELTEFVVSLYSISEYLSALVFSDV